MVSFNNDIRFTDRIQSVLSEELGKTSFSSLFVLTDSNTAEHCLPIIKDVLPVEFYHINVAAGERFKTLATCEEIWQALTVEQADRHTLLINLGGGVICDMGGFCARTYKRGIQFWNVPTTVLSQVDASVGGKLGVDFGAFKNHLGLFSEPDIVFIDPVFFETLPADEVLSGFAEMVKHTLIRDPDSFKRIVSEDVTGLNWNEWIPDSIEIKKAVVEADPTEQGLRKILNFGHTIGHAIESHFLTSPNPLKHGEAIALGMITEAYLSHMKLSLSKNDFRSISNFLAELYPTPLINEESIEEIAKLAFHDKKNKDGIIKAVLLAQIGSPEIDQPISKTDIKDALIAYNETFAK